jgi:hypothetical protein
MTARVTTYYKDGGVGENAAMGYGSPQSVVSAWLSELKFFFFFLIFKKY